MKRLTITAVLILVLGTVASAMQATQPKTFMGAIASIDTEAKLLTVRDATSNATDAKTMSFKIDAQTKIESSAEGATELEALEVGEHVNVSYVGADGDYVARTITVQTKPTT